MRLRLDVDEAGLFELVNCAVPTVVQSQCQVTTQIGGKCAHAGHTSGSVLHATTSGLTEQPAPAGGDQGCEKRNELPRCVVRSQMARART